jgi:hypothetical protein
MLLKICTIHNVGSFIVAKSSPLTPWRCMLIIMPQRPYFRSLSISSSEVKTYRSVRGRSEGCLPRSLHQQ